MTQLFSPSGRQHGLKHDGQHTQLCTLLREAGWRLNFVPGCPFRVLLLDFSGHVFIPALDTLQHLGVTHSASVATIVHAPGGLPPPELPLLLALFCFKKVRVRAPVAHPVLDSRSAGVISHISRKEGKIAVDQHQIGHLPYRSTVDIHVYGYLLVCSAIKYSIRTARAENLNL